MIINLFENNYKFIWFVFINFFIFAVKSIVHRKDNEIKTKDIAYGG